MTIRTFYAYDHEAPAEEEPNQAPERDTGDPHNIAWGYNLADLDRCARIAISRTRGRWGDPVDRYQNAWSAIAEHLCTASAYPDKSELVYAGWAAVANESVRSQGFLGHDARTSGSMPSFARYWRPPAATGIDERIVESMALWQILAVLTPRHRRAVTALAAADDYDSAAAAMGTTRAGFETALKEARRAFLARWYEGETPPRRRRVNLRKPRAGHNRITVSQLEQIRARHLAGESITALAAEYGFSRSSVSLMLAGKRRPIPDIERTRT